jgi:hypothetical protein
MYDAGKVIAGIIIFLSFLTFPVWYNALKGKAAYIPDLKIVTKEKQCVESTGYMRTNHIKLLNEWRDAVVREGNRLYVASDGKRYEMSLSGTCLKCHLNKADFCDRCHNYLQVRPACFHCHVVPEERKS